MQAHTHDKLKILTYSGRIGKAHRDCSTTPFIHRSNIHGTHSRLSWGPNHRVCEDFQVSSARGRFGLLPGSPNEQRMGVQFPDRRDSRLLWPRSLFSCSSASSKFTTSADEATAAAVRNSRTRAGSSSLLGRRSRSRRDSSGLRSGEEKGAGGFGSGVGGDPESTSELPRQSKSLKNTQVNTSKPTPGPSPIRQQQMLLLSKAPMKNLGLFGSRSASTSGRALDQLHVPGSAKKLARNVHLHEVKPAGRDENSRREAKAKLKDREIVKNLDRDSEGVGKIPFPSSHGQNTAGEPDTDSAWVDDTDVEGSISSPQIEKHDHDAWLRQSNGFLSPFELAPPPKPQHRRTTKPAENLKLDIKESSFDPVLQQANLI